MPSCESRRNPIFSLGCEILGIFLLMPFGVAFFALRTFARLVPEERLYQEILKIPALRDFSGLILLPDCNNLSYTWVHWIEILSILYEVYFMEAYDRFFTPRKGWVVVDVGAHIGMYSLKTAKKIGDEGSVIAVEPENQNFRLLTRNIRMNKCRNVVPEKLALSNFDGKAELYLGSGSGTHTLLKRSSAGTKVLVTTITKLLEKLKVEKVDLIKIDVEGAELEVLKGAEGLLKSRKICRIAVAAYHAQWQADEIEGYLQAFGYATRSVEISWQVPFLGTYSYSYVYSWLPHCE